MNTNTLSENKQSATTFGRTFTIGEKVTHQDKEAGEATILSFEMSNTHLGEVKVITDKGFTHLDFLEKL